MAKSKTKDATLFSDRLLNWWDQHGRKDLPWQFDKTPYRVWVSEIMLQQTQVASVIEYYQRFMASFPRLEDLANAHEDSVLEHWAGLGYYARARNLHKTAKRVHDDYAGKFPDTLDDIVTLPGIGRSTAGAILSIAFKERAPILDGNVKRVLCRYRAIQTWPGEKKTENDLWEIADAFTPSHRVEDYTQAIMDLGATLCTRSKPNCDACPMNTDCEAQKQGLQSELPKSKPKKAIPLKKTWALHIVNDQGALLFEKRPSSGIWGGLYSLPELAVDHSIDEIKQHCQDTWGFHVHSASEQKGFVHTFSHYKLQIQPLLLSVTQAKQQINEANQYHWFDPESLKNIGMPAPIEKYLSKNTQPELALSIE